MNEQLQNLIDRFNPAQREATVNTDGPCLVIAGAGSGKTSVLTARIAALMEKGVPPERILALTFTKKAAEEMRNRIIALEGDAARRICMGTFHSVFIRFLRPNADRVRFPDNFTILDEDDSLSCLKRCIAEVLASRRPDKANWTDAQKKQYAAEDKSYKPKAIAGIISALKNDLVTADAYAQDKDRLKADDRAGRTHLSEIYLHYRNACYRAAVMDFDDILLYTDMLLACNPDVKAMIAGAFDYILVDEYQDTNLAQYSILRHLTWLNRNICVVGDDSQSIYAFRGARIENILGFHRDYDGCRVVKLEQNYRSTRNIVNAANNLISRNDGRLPKTCFTDGDKGSPISVHTEPSEKAEAQYVAQLIKGRHEQEDKPWEEFAVLYRTNAQSRALEDALIRAHVPYKIYSGVSFFTRMEVKDLMAYFKLAVNPCDDESFARVINKPARGIGEAAMSRLHAIASTWNMSLWDTINNGNFPMCGFGPKVMEGFENFKENIGYCMELARTKSAYEAASIINGCAGFYNKFVEEGDEESMKRADNIRELVDSVKSYEEDAAENDLPGDDGKPVVPTLQEYLQSTLLLSNADTAGDPEGKVSLMTVHCAKGLEFDTVFVTGMEKGLFPLEIDRTPDELEEERRLFYVAVTRAKQTLVLTKANTRMKFGKREFNEPSRFISELGGKKPKPKEDA